MVKIKIERFRFMGTEHVVDIKYDGRKEHFYIDLPEAWSSILQTHIAEGDTIKKVRENFKSLAALYLNRANTVEKAIVYSWKDYHNSVGLSYKIVYTVDLGDKRVFFKEMKDGIFSWQNFIKVGADACFNYENYVLWTPTRENFFKNIEKAIKEIGERGDKFFSQDREKVLNMIDSNIKLIEGGN